jgi:hypothetical protein
MQNFDDLINSIQAIIQDADEKKNAVGPIIRWIDREKLYDASRLLLMMSDGDLGLIEGYFQETIGMYGKTPIELIAAGRMDTVIKHLKMMMGLSDGEKNPELYPN